MQCPGCTVSVGAGGLGSPQPRSPSALCAAHIQTPVPGQTSRESHSMGTGPRAPWAPRRDKTNPVSGQLMGRHCLSVFSWVRVTSCRGERWSPRHLGRRDPKDGPSDRAHPHNPICVWVAPWRGIALLRSRPGAPGRSPRGVHSHYRGAVEAAVWVEEQKGH